MDHQYGENDVRNIYSNYNQIRDYVECSLNQAKNVPYRPFNRAVDKNVKIAETC